MRCRAEKPHVMCGFSAFLGLFGPIFFDTAEDKNPIEFSKFWRYNFTKISEVPSAEDRFLSIGPQAMKI